MMDYTVGLCCVAETGRERKKIGRYEGKKGGREEE